MGGKPNDTFELIQDRNFETLLSYDVKVEIEPKAVDLDAFDIIDKENDQKQINKIEIIHEDDKDLIDEEEKVASK